MTIPTSLLLPQVVDGVADRRGRARRRRVLRRSRPGGGARIRAHGIAMGTRFLLTAESQVPGITDIYMKTPRLAPS